MKKNKFFFKCPIIIILFSFIIVIGTLNNSYALDETTTNINNIYLDYVYNNKINSVEEYSALVSYIDSNFNQTSQAFMDTFLVSPNAGYKIQNSSGSYVKMVSYDSITKTNWEQYMNGWIKNLDVLNTTIENINTKTDSNFKINIFLSIIFPGENQQIASTKTGAVKYFVDSQLEMFKNKSYSNLNLVGFYWYKENVRSSEEEDLMRYFTSYVKSLNYKSLWIPYIDNYPTGNEWDEGNRKYKLGYSSYNFDIVSIQSGYYFHEEVDDKTVDSFYNLNEMHRLPFANQEANNMDMYVEVEADSDLYVNVEKLKKYLEFIKYGLENKWNQKLKIYYFPNLYLSATSKNNYNRYVYDLSYGYASKTLNSSNVWDYSNITEEMLKGYDFFDCHDIISNGKNYTSTSPYTDNNLTGYTNVSGNELTDEIYGSDSYGTNWIAFKKDSDDSKYWITVDLGKIYSGISFFGLELEKQESSGIGLPSNVEVFYSDDNINFTSLGNCSYDEKAPISQALSYLRLSGSESISARYVKFEMDKGTSTFVFVSELIVANNDIELCNEEVKVLGINLNDDNLSLNVGKTKKLDVTISPDNATNKNVIWTSSTPEVATVSEDGVINPLKAGTTTIMVTSVDGGFVDQCIITVIDETEEYLNINNLSVSEIDKIIYSIDLNVSYDELIKNIDTNGTITLLDNSNNNITSSNNVKTNEILKIEFPTKIIEYKISVLGDVTGSGNVNIGDIAKLYQNVKGKITLTKSEEFSGDIVNDNKIAINDVAKLYAYLKGRINNLK